MAKGGIYILNNPSMKLLKIGQSSKDPSDRAVELSQATGVPTPFKIEYIALVESYQEVERNVHRLLNSHRINPQREFFECSVNEAVQAVKTASTKILHEEPQFINNPRRNVVIESVISPATEESIRASRRAFFERTKDGEGGTYFTKCVSCGSMISVSFQWRYPESHKVVCNCVECGWTGSLTANKFEKARSI